MQEGFRWDFEVLNEADYRLVLTYIADNNIFNSLLRRSKNKLEKKQGIKLPDNVLEQFTIPEDQKKHMIPLLNRATKKNVAYVQKIVKEDGIVCINSKVIDAYYNKLKSEEWEIKVFIKGQFRAE